MRPAFLAGLVFALSPAAGLTQTGPYLAVVADPEAKLRAGPSDQFPETATLPKGSQLLVDHEEPNGWLAVQDPPGKMYSLSWVQASFVDFDNNKPTPQRVVVEEETKLAAGQIGLAQPLTHIRRTAVPAGTILTVIGAKAQFEGKWWHPVAPPAGDFRYLPKQAVKTEKAVNTMFTVRDALPPSDPAGALPPGGGSAVVPASGARGNPAPGSSSPPAPASRPAVNHPLWAQAEAAERDGRFDDAEKLFFQLARVMNEAGGDHDIANLCYTRIHTLREKRRGGDAVVGGSPALPSALGAPTRPPTGDSAKPPPGDAKDDRPRWTGPGRLRPSALAIDGRRTYALESNAGVTLVYVVAGQGVDLERAVGKKVDVFGASYTRSGLSKPYVVATVVESAQ